MTSFEVHDLSYIVNKEWRKAFTENKFVERIQNYSGMEKKY